MSAGAVTVAFLVGSDRELADVAVHRALGQLEADMPTARAAFLAPLGKEEARLDLTDGLRMVLTDGDVIHVRPSGNAPELRVYCEAATPELAQKAATACLSLADRFKQTA